MGKYPAGKKGAVKRKMLKKDILMNMDFEQLLKQEVQKAARQDYEEITAKAQVIHINF